MMSLRLTAVLGHFLSARMRIGPTPCSAKKGSLEDPKGNGGGAQPEHT